MEIVELGFRSINQKIFVKKIGWKKEIWETVDMNFELGIFQ